MKGFLEKYRNISVWLSLFILAMWFVGASDQENRMPCMLLAFLAGAGIFGSGAAREFHDLVYHGYLERDLGGYRNVLFKMKELWLYQVKLFPEVNGLEKKIKKLQTQQEYEQLMGKLQAVS